MLGWRDASNAAPEGDVRFCFWSSMLYPKGKGSTHLLAHANYAPAISEYK